MNIPPRIPLASLLLAAAIQLTLHAEVPLTPGVTLRFATAEEARRLLTERDDFVERLSPFDRSARLKTDQLASAAEYLAFVGAQALDWSPAEQEKLAAAVAAIGPRLAELKLPLPPTIDLVRTTGREEGGAFYTRGAAIFFPTRALAGADDARTQQVLAHELFHVLSRAAPELREKLYAAIGFAQCGEVALPADLADRRITNPDAPRNDHCIELTIAGRRQWAVPIIFSRQPQYDPRRGGEFFEYLELRFLAVDRDDQGAATPALDAAGQPTLAQSAEVDGLFEQIGHNTQLIIHPEEILADNFALLALGEQKVVSPEVLQKLTRVLQDGAGDAESAAAKK